MNAQQLGTWGEQQVIGQLQQHGIVASSSSSFNGDVLANGWKLEVKTAAPDALGRFKFCLYKYGKTDYRHSDFVLLQCVDSEKIVWYLIPTAAIEQKHICIGSRHSSSWATWKRSFGDIVVALA